jgi:hypothetical protein
MFDISLDSEDLEPNLQDSTNDTDMRDEDLIQTLASLNFQIAALQSELTLKSSRARGVDLS